MFGLGPGEERGSSWLSATATFLTELVLDEGGSCMQQSSKDVLLSHYELEGHDSVSEKELK